MFCIRKMRREDVADVAELERKIFTDAWSEQAILETLDQKQTMILLAYEDKKLIGYLILYYVLEDGEIACEDNGVSKLLLDVRESNICARRFYEKHGFVQDGLRKDYYSEPVEDGILMSCEL